MLKLISKRKKELTNSEVNLICALKDSEWKYGLSSQKKFFEKFQKKNDLCNFLYFKNDLVGFTVLRKRLYRYNNIRGDFLLLDSMILKKKYRKNNFKELLMNFNNQIIKLENKFGILFCKNQLLKFYKKFNWKKYEKKKLKVEGYNKIDYVMAFNFKKNYKKIFLFVNK